MQSHEPQNTPESAGFLSRNVAFATKRATSRPARNRRRAKDLAEPKLREIKSDFEQLRNTLEVAQNHMLPRSEAVDAILMRLGDDFRNVQAELIDLRRQVGLGGDARPFLVRRQA